MQIYAHLKHVQSSCLSKGGKSHGFQHQVPTPFLPSPLSPIVSVAHDAFYEKKNISSRETSTEASESNFWRKGHKCYSQMSFNESDTPPQGTTTTTIPSPLSSTTFTVALRFSSSSKALSPNFFQPYKEPPISMTAHSTSRCFFSCVLSAQARKAIEQI